MARERKRERELEGELAASGEVGKSVGTERVREDDDSNGILYNIERKDKHRFAVVQLCFSCSRFKTALSFPQKKINHNK